MAQIVRFYETGSPDVLKIENIDAATPGSGEVRIKVKAFGLNRAEAMYREGKYLIHPQFPSRLGYEASGVVEAVGPDVTDFSPGDIVSNVPMAEMNKYGVYGDTATLLAHDLVRHPPSLTFEEATSIWMQYLTAYGALFDIANITKGDYVVIPAASSSVGIAAIQLCNLVGAQPIAVTRTWQKKKALEDAGAKFVIASQVEDLLDKLKSYTQGNGARVVFDPVGGSTVQTLAQGMAYGGIMIEYGALSAEQTPFPLMQALKKGLTMRGYTLFELLSNDQRRKKAIDFVLKELADGHLKPVIAKTFPLSEIVEAHRYLESNQQFGKIVVTV